MTSDAADGGRVITVAMPWALLGMVMVFAVGVVIFRTLDGQLTPMLEMISPWLDQTDAGQSGVATVQTIWGLWPLWFLGALFAYGLIESVRKSNRPGGVQ